MICAYCHQPAELITGKVLYLHRRDLWTKKFWRCTPCQAWVGCHSKTDNPLGRLANAELRAAKSKVHLVFDVLWKDRGWKRTDAYLWLAEKMGLPPNQCHIGMFDLAQCEKAYALLLEWGSS